VEACSLFPPRFFVAFYELSKKKKTEKDEGAKKNKKQKIAFLSALFLTPRHKDTHYKKKI